MLSYHCSWFYFSQPWDLLFWSSGLVLANLSQRAVSRQPAFTMILMRFIFKDPNYCAQNSAHVLALKENLEIHTVLRLCWSAQGADRYTHKQLRRNMVNGSSISSQDWAARECAPQSIFTSLSVQIRAHQRVVVKTLSQRRFSLNQVSMLDSPCCTQS